MMSHPSPIWCTTASSSFSNAAFFVSKIILDVSCMTSVKYTIRLRSGKGTFCPTHWRRAGVPKSATHGYSWHQRFSLVREGLRNWTRISLRNAAQEIYMLTQDSSWQCYSDSRDVCQDYWTSGPSLPERWAPARHECSNLKHRSPLYHQLELSFSSIHRLTRK